MERHGVFRILPLLIATLILIGPDTALGTASDGTTKARGGEFACGANWSTRGHSSHWTVRNVNESHAIKLERLRIYDGDGSLLFDSQSVSPGEIIDPHETGSFRSENLVADGNLPADMSFQPGLAIFTWSSMKGMPVLTPYAYLTRGGAGDKRHQADCRTTRLVGHKDSH